MAIKAKLALIHGLKSTDPVHDTLLQAYIAAEEGQVMSITGLSIMSGVKSTTWLRYMNTLVEQGLLVRTPDPDDARRHWIALSPATKARMDKLLDPR